MRRPITTTGHRRRGRSALAVDRRPRALDGRGLPLQLLHPIARVFLHGTQGTDSDKDPNNSRLFVSCLDRNVTDEDLKQAFSPYGELVDVKIVAGKHFGFVTYPNRASAEEAMNMLNGSQLGANTIRLSWGRRPANKQDQWNSGHYGRPQCHDPSGFGWCPQDPYA